MFLEGTFLFPDIHIKLTDWQWCCVHLCLYNQACTSFCNTKNMYVKRKWEQNSSTSNQGNTIHLTIFDRIH